MRVRLSKPRRRPPLDDRRLLLGAIRLLTEASGLAALLENECGGSTVLHVILVGEGAMRALNRSFTGRDELTDVLAFDLRGTPAVPEPAAIAAEIYVCLDVAVDAARRFGTDVNYEIMLYIAHGCLHLSGKDDHDAAARADMRRAERRIMTKLARALPLEQLFRAGAVCDSVGCCERNRRPQRRRQ